MIEILWLMILSTMLILYVIMDGFDFGAGIHHLFVARNSSERSLIQRSIGPFWDGNEVWLIAAGGVVFLAFPLLYAVVFSGFYLALMLVLWMLIFRAISLELRHQLHSPLWENFWDLMFGISSLSLSLLFGVALGNLVRGVNLGGIVGGESHYSPEYFFTPLWTDFLTGENPGVIDWFTLMMGLVAVLTLGLHGGNWIRLKTEHAFSERVAAANKIFWRALLAIVPLSIWAAITVRPALLDNYFATPFLAVIPALGGVSLLLSGWWSQDGKKLPAFFASSGFIAAMLAATAIGIFPEVLPSSNGINAGLTVHQAAAGQYGLQAALYWWIPAIFLVAGYFVLVHRLFSGKIADEEH